MPPFLANGITPARAGRRGRRGGRVGVGWNHSRAGGTERALPVVPAVCPESLPRGRDGDGQHTHEGRRFGITPARAGRSHDLVDQRARVRNHSRAGGTELVAGPRS